MDDRFTELEKMEIDAEPVLKEYFPKIFELLGDNIIDWNSVSEIYKKVLMSRIEKLRKIGIDKTFERDLTLFDIVTKKINGTINQSESENIQMIFMEDLLEDLTNVLNVEEKKEIKDIAFNFVTQPNRNFKNFLGEFAILNNFKSHGYNLTKTEEPLFDEFPKGKTIDFSFYKDNQFHYVEVLNFHLTKKNTSTDLDIEREINKLNEKFQMKGHNPLKEYWIYPVMWGQFEELEKVYNYLVKNGLIDNVYRPVTYMVFGTGEESIYMFDELSKIIAKRGSPVEKA